jgi:hypothetical protein
MEFSLKGKAAPSKIGVWRLAAVPPLLSRFFLCSHMHRSISSSMATYRILRRNIFLQYLDLDVANMSSVDTLEGS